jgi:large subunit ribosomal protein L35
MPKMKTHSGAKKRFKVTASGKVRGRHPFTSHILEKKSPKKKRALGAPKIMDAHDAPRIKRMLGAPTASGRPSASSDASDRAGAGARKPAGGDS